jgi:hypothetical protein
MLRSLPRLRGRAGDRRDVGPCMKWLSFPRARVRNISNSGDDERPRSRGAIAPEFCKELALRHRRGRRECRVKASPMAPVQSKSTGKEPQVQPIHPGIPCAMVLRLIARSPRGPGFLAPVARSARHASELGLSVGRPGPHAFAVRDDIVRPTMHRVHRIPRPTFVTTAKRPSDERGTMGVKHIITKNGSKIFLREGLDGRKESAPGALTISMRDGRRQPADHREWREHLHDDQHDRDSCRI